MKLIFRILRILSFLLIAAIVAIVIYLFVGLPKKEAPQNVTIQATPASLERGEYLAKHVNVCFYCHVDRNAQFFAHPPKPGTEGQGGLFVKDPELGEIYSPNITPHAIGNWTDGELIRAVIAGVNRDGDPLFPIMPYEIYAHLKQEDLHAVIAYIRTLKPVHKEIPRTKLKFPMNLIVRMIPGPRKGDPKVQADPGHYLTTVAGCIGCHTPIDDRGQHLPGLTLAGGQKFGAVQSANITPDMETGIGKWSKQDFLAAFKKWQAPEMQQIVVAEDKNTVMPWIDFSGMKEEDLGLIYDYLRTVPAISHKVERFPQPTP